MMFVFCAPVPRAFPANSKQNGMTVPCCSCLSGTARNGVHKPIYLAYQSKLASR